MSASSHTAKAAEILRPPLHLSIFLFLNNRYPTSVSEAKCANPAKDSLAPGPNLSDS